MEPPPGRVRIPYYLFDARVPPAWLEWAERDIASPAWVAREVARLLVAFAVFAAVSSRFSLRALVVLAVCVGIIFAVRNVLRRIALAYQRYGWEWDTDQGAAAPWIRLVLAAVFAAAIVLLTR